MQLINRKILDQFKRKHPRSISPLSMWENLMSKSIYNSFIDLRKTFASADYLSSGYTVFNIGGNKYRLIVEIDYSLELVDITAIWTHAEYSQSIRRGNL